MATNFPDILELERLVRMRTQHRIKELSIAVEDGRIVLHGRVSSFHLKQLAQHGVLDVLPNSRLVNAIEVAQ
jgi:hypothetical protein